MCFLMYSSIKWLSFSFKSVLTLQNKLSMIAFQGFVQNKLPVFYEVFVNSQFLQHLYAAKIESGKELNKRRLVG